MEYDFSKVLITGAGGMVGSYVDFGIQADRHFLDITDLKEVMDACAKYSPSAILHLAAETDVDRCERDPEYAYKVNGIGTYNLALAAKQIGAKLVYISTAGVFDGEKAGPYSESDEPNPQNYYGHSKFLGELAIQGILKDYLILRVCWMMGGGPEKDQKFAAKIIRQLLNQEVKKIMAVKDQIGSPTFAKDLIRAAKILISENKRGIFHLGNHGVASRYEVAKFIMDFFGSKKSLEQVESSFFGLDAKRTKNEGLASRVDLMRPWDEALKDYLNSEWTKKLYDQKNKNLIKAK